MGQEKFIEGKHDDAHHAGRHSIRMALDAFNAKYEEWRRERRGASESGHQMPWTPEELNVIDQYYPEGQDQEIVLFDARIQPDNIPYQPTQRPTYQTYELGGGKPKS